MKRQFKQWWSIIPLTSTKQTITSHLNSLNTKKTTTCDVENPMSWLRTGTKIILASEIQ